MSRYVVMGVSGCGKSTVGQELARTCGLDFVDGDSLHAEASIAKMARGTPLDDVDRAPWLKAVGDRLRDGTIIACSALTRAYRDVIRARAGGEVTFLYLRGRRDTLLQRMGARTGHFMPVALLDSQLALLQEPMDDEKAITVDIELPLERVVATLAERIGQG